MANAKLSVEIGAKIEGLQKGISDAKKVVDDFSKQGSNSLQRIDRNLASLSRGFLEVGKNQTQIVSLSRRLDELQKASALSKSAKEISIYNSQIDALQKRLARFRALDEQGVSAIKGTSNSLKSVSIGSDKAAFALTNLGRVAQDAPYGFIGIQNNLNPLLESFQRLQAETGSAKGALAALGKSLIGPAGLGLALSVVGAAILFYNQYQQKSTKATQEQVDANKKLIDSQSQELSKLVALYDASQNLNLPLETRKKVVKELQDLYPDTFKNFKEEAILAGKAAGAYDALSQSIINAAIVKAAQNNLEEQIKPYSELINSLEQQQAKLDAINEKRQKEAKSQGKLATNIVLDTQFFVDENGNTINIADYKKQLQDKINLARQALKNVTEKFGIQGLGKINFFDTTKYNRTKIDPIDLNAIKKLNEFEIGLNKVGLQFIKIAQSKLPETDISKLVKGEKQLVKVPLEIELVNPEITPESQLRLLKAFEGLKPKIQDAVSGFFNSIPDAFASLGEVLAQGGNPIEAFGNVLLGSFSDFLKQFGKLLIEYGAAGLGLATVTKALLNPLTAGPAAIAAIAAGIALEIAAGAIKGLISGGGSGKSGKSGIPGFATGVTNYEGGLAIVGESGRELVQLPTGSSVVPNYKTESLLNGMSSSNNLNVVFDTLRITNDAIYIAAKKGAEKLGKII